MNEAVFLCIAENFHSLIIGYIVTLMRFTAIVGEIAYTDTPAVIIIGTALIKSRTGSTAGATGNADMSLIFFKPI